MIPTAGGKTPLLSTICRDAVQLWDGRVLILAHVKELLEQAVDKLRAVAPDLRIGVYSAGLNRRDTQHAVIVAGIQSVYKRACELDAFDLVIVDECHLIPEEGDGMYRQFLTDARKVNPNLRVIGLTATPYRMKSGLICGPDNILNEVCYEVGIRELIRDGYLCPLVTKAGRQKADTSELHIRGGEFVAGELEDLMDQDALVEAACAEIVEQTRARQACLIFASGVRHGQHVASVLAEKHGIECGFVCGDTSGGQRAELLARFRGVPSDGLFERSPLKYLCNVNVLTTGFDAPNVDCVALLRPTMSPGLYYQMVGRGFRLHPGKKDCLVLDFGGNVLRHGPVDQIRVRERDGDGGEAPVKECPACHSLVAAGYASCPDWAPILPGEAAGSIFVAGSFDDLLEPGEARKTPAGGNDNLSFFSLGFGFPSSPAYTGSTFDFEGTLTMGGHQVSYASTVTISRAAGSSSPRYGPPRRISSAVPEPTALSLAVLALACCFPAIRKWRRP